MSDVSNTPIQCDVAVYGATPAGICAAVTAARYGRRAVLCAYGEHVGGLLSSGLSIANIRYLQAHGGPFAEFARAVERHYVTTYGRDAPQVRECRGGTWWEPHVAEAVFEALLEAEPLIEVIRDVRLLGVSVTAGRLDGFTVGRRAGVGSGGETGAPDAGNAASATRGQAPPGAVFAIRAPVSVDATYEADLAAAAGVPYWVGREGREAYWEPHAGVISFGAGAKQEVWPGSTGAADKRIQAFCFRLSVTQDAARAVPFPRPEAYDPDDYLDVRRPIEAGRVRRLSDVMHLGPGRLRVNGKADVIANLVGGADDYPEADEETREAIVRRHRDYTLGLFWFLQHDPCVPEAVRDEACSWGLAADEFADNGHVPYELYVREARRIQGLAVATEHDFMLEPGAERSPLHADAVAVADYYLDSHATQHLHAPPYEEGHLNIRATRPGQVRWGSLVPRGVSGLLVPVAVSSTHAGFSVIRMEPVWMALGAAAATAAHLAQATGASPEAVPVEALQAELARHDQRLAFFHDVPLECHSPGLQFFATKGFFGSFYARPDEPVSRFEAAHWLDRVLDLARSGRAAALDGSEGYHTGPGTATPPGASPASLPFADVPPGDPFFARLQRLHRLGIVDGWLESAGFGGTASLRRLDARRWASAAAAHLASQTRASGPAHPGPGAGTGAARDDRPVTPWGGEDGLGGRPYAPTLRVELCDYLFETLTRATEALQPPTGRAR